MKDPKKILYEFQILSLEIGRTQAFPTDFSYVFGQYNAASGKIPRELQANNSMSNEKKTNTIIDYIFQHWNECDIDIAVKYAEKKLPKLRELFYIHRNVFNEYELLCL